MYDLDLTGIACPMPVLKTKKFLATINSGERVRILTTDPAAEIDLQEFCRKTDNLLIEQIIQNAQIITIIQRR
jgi:tRNA 2-thiouridine synthesizing protein A